MLHVYNTMSRKKEQFEPLHPPFVGMYVCGPTVYDDPHLGHAKSYISFDIMVRYMRYLDYKVRYVQNITDVGHLLGDQQDGEDRILKRAKLENLEPVEIAQKYERRYFRDMDRLNCLRPDISCRASGHIPEMIELVQTLIDKGYGYEADGNVYFDVSKFEEYGKLSGRKVEDLMEGVRVDVAEGKRQSADFALWKKADPEHLMQWNSPWGKGFPGWHLECSVMAEKYIDKSIDIHGGGLDNQFPHHECEIAQSEAVNEQPFVKYWIHNNMVTVDGKKMSKSLGNHMTLEALFEKYDPMTVRFFVLQGHYRSPQDFSEQALSGAEKGFERMLKTVAAVREAIQNEKKQDSPPADGKWSGYKDRFCEYLDDDFNTSGALSVLFDLVKVMNEALSADTKPDLLAGNRLFADLGENILGLQFESKTVGADHEMTDGLVQMLIYVRKQYREEKAWAKADEIRDQLLNLGVTLEDGPAGTTWRKN